MPVDTSLLSLRSGSPVRRRIRLFIALSLATASTAFAQMARGPDWIVAFSLPTQDEATFLKGEFSIRDLLIDHINRLQAGHRAAVATFTFSGDSDETGAAGPILCAISNALDRGAAVHFVADSMVKRAKEYQPGLSLNRLAKRRPNPMTLSVAPRSALMHHKAATFDYGDDNQWTLVASGNFTGAANMRQWNVAVLLRNPDLFRAFDAEMEEFRARRFGGKKDFLHDRTPFRLQDSWDTCWIRFGPYPRTANEAVNAETDIRRLFHGAQEEIYFAMHHFNRPSLRRALVAAANRGVKVFGVMPESDRGSGPCAISGPTARYFLNPAHYTGTNRVNLLPARADALGTAWDSGEQDLVHSKYAIIDPNGLHPFVIHGAANWTYSGLATPNANDESILFLRHRDIAQAFLTHFRTMTGTLPAGGPESDVTESSD